MVLKKPVLHTATADVLWCACTVIVISTPLHLMMDVVAAARGIWQTGVLNFEKLHVSDFLLLHIFFSKKDVRSLFIVF